MQRQPVKSSNLRSVGYEGDTLEVEFSNGTVFAYTGVPADVHAAMIRADSIGSYFAKEVRGKFTATKKDADAK